MCICIPPWSILVNLVSDSPAWEKLPSIACVGRLGSSELLAFGNIAINANWQ